MTYNVFGGTLSLTQSIILKYDAQMSSAYCLTCMAGDLCRFTSLWWISLTCSQSTGNNYVGSAFVSWCNKTAWSVVINTLNFGVFLFYMSLLQDCLKTQYDKFLQVIITYKETALKV